MSNPRSSDAPSNVRHIVLGTLSFAVSFAAWGLISAFAPRFREMFSLSPSQTSLLIAVPVLLGSLGRLPIGMLADRFGGRSVFTVLLIAVAVPAWLVPHVESYRELLLVAFFLGIAGSAFPVGVGYVSRWTPAARQGSALGVYGLGNIGQSAAVFLGPLIAAVVGWQPVFRGVAVLLVAWGVAFGLLARNAPVAAKPGGMSAMFRVLTREKLAWVLSLFYFLTFGGFVAFSIYLPTLLKVDRFPCCRDRGRLAQPAEFRSPASRSPPRRSGCAAASMDFCRSSTPLPWSLRSSSSRSESSFTFSSARPSSACSASSVLTMGRAGRISVRPANANRWRALSSA
jgi:NNP family nitrate/nitrite transporter-like MFS transporter